jgi:hypothetical protein
MTAGPANASSDKQGVRLYAWTPADGGEPTVVLSVTSIRKVCGTPFDLINWMLSNVIDVTMGTAKQTKVGPRGGVSEVRVSQEFPPEFAKRLAASDGKVEKLDDLRKWVKEQADKPRNIAALRGSITHKAIEQNVRPDNVDRGYLTLVFDDMGRRDRAAVLTDEDVLFVQRSVTQYWDLRSKLPHIVIAREPQVWNLTAGYAGSPDALVWTLPAGYTGPIPRAHDVTLEMVRSVGGTLAIWDYKTAKDVYTDNVVQITAYGAAEFVGSNGVIDRRLTELLNATTDGALVHIRPDKWAVDYFPFTDRVRHAFLGSVAFARFLTEFPRPEELFNHKVEGSVSL